MKKLSGLIIFLFCALYSYCQFPNNQSVSNNSTIYHIKGAVKGDEATLLTIKDTLNNPATFYPGAVTVRPQDTVGHVTFPIYQSNGVYWTKISSSTFIIPGVDSVTLYGNQLCQWQGGIPTCYFLTASSGGDIDSLHLNFDSTYILQYRNGTLRDSVFLIHTNLSVDNHLSLIQFGGPYDRLLSATRLIDSVFASPYGSGFNYYRYADGSIDSLLAGGGGITTIQWSVRDSLSTPSLTPQNADKFLVGTSPTGAFVGEENHIATYDSVTATYSFQSPIVGDLLYNANNTVVSKWTGTAWVWVGTLLLHQGGESPTYGDVVAGSKGNFNFRFITNNETHNWVSPVGVMNVDSVPIWRGAAKGYNIGSIAFGEKTLIANTTGFENVALGDSAMIKNTTGPRNTAIGKDALQQNTTGSANTMIGWIAGQQNTTGDANTAIGMQALVQNQTGTENTAVGHQAMFFKTGNYNSAFGAEAMSAGTTGDFNTAIGEGALRSNNVSNNTAVGYRSQYSSNSGTGENTSIGYLSLFNNASGTINVGIGSNALYTNSTGASNVAIGTYAMLYNTTGSLNTALGYHALYNNLIGSNNVVVGQEAGAYKDGSTGGASFNLDKIDNSILIGKRASPGADSLVHVVVIGDSAVGPGISHTITLGNNTNVATYLGGYGAGSITGTATYNLAVDANHKIIEVATGGGASVGTLQQVLNTGNLLNRADSIRLGGNTLTFQGGNVGIGNAPTDLFQVSDNTNVLFEVSPSLFHTYLYSTDNTSNGIIATVSDLSGLNVRTYMLSSNGVNVPEIGVLGIDNTIYLRTNGNGAEGSILIQDSSLATASNGYAWILIDQTTGRGAWQAVSGGGGNTIYTGDGSVTGNRTVDLDGNNLTISDAGGTQLSVFPSTGEIFMSTPTGKLLSISDNDNELLMQYDGSNKVQISSAGTTVTGNLSYNTPPNGLSTDSILTWDATTKVINKRTVSSFAFGTVTSVATGLGLSGGTITTTGTLLVDTSSASILSRQRAAATYALIGAGDSTYFWSKTGNVAASGSTFLGTLTNTSLRFRTNNTERMFIDSARNFVGIGTSAPTSELELKSATQPVLRLNGATTGSPTIRYQAAGVDKFQLGMDLDGNGIFDFYIYDHTTAKVKFRSMSTGQILIGADASAIGTATMSIGNTGLVGIGGVTPTAVLHIKAGTATAQSAPLKFTTGTLLTTAEAGAMEFLTDGYYVTTTTGAKRRFLAAATAGRATAQTAANASVATYTLGASDASYEVSANVLVTTSSAEAFTVTCAYTDEGNTARTVTLPFALLAGTTAAAINFANGAVPYEGIPIHLRVKASTAITIATTGTFTGATYNVEGIIKQTQ